MFQNNTANKIIAVLGAVLLWAYVVGTVDPIVTEKFEQIPISIINEDSLTDQGLAIIDTGELDVDLTLKGTRAELSKVEISDIKVTADVYNRHKGKNYVNIEVQVPKGISIESKSEDKVLIEIEELVTEKRDVEAKLKGEVKEGFVVGDMRIYPDEVSISGSKSTVAKVDHVNVIVDVKEIDEDGSEILANLIPVDKHGATVNHVTLSSKKATVSTILEQVKEFDLDIKTIGSIDDMLTVEKLTIPDKIWLRGTKQDLSGITVVKAESINLNGITKSKEIKINPYLPESVKVASKSEGLVVNIVIAKPISATYNFEGKDIEYKNLEEGLIASCDENFAVKVIGDKKIIDVLKKNNIKILADLKGKKEGSHKIALNAEIVNSLVEFEFIPNKVLIDIGKE